MALFIGEILCEAAIGVVLSSLVSSREKSSVLTKVNRISEVVSSIKSQLDNVEKHLNRGEDPEIRKFREIKDKATIIFHGNWDVSIVDFASELILPILDHKFMGLRLSISSSVVDLDHMKGFRKKSFSVVLKSANTVVNNLQALRLFFHKIMEFNSSGRIPKHEPVRMTIEIVRGYCESNHEYERLVGRICVRFAFLNTLALNWGEDSRGSLDLAQLRLSKQDCYSHKFILTNEIPGTDISRITERILSESSRSELSNILRRAVLDGVSSIKLIILSDYEWNQNADLEKIIYYTPSVRSFTDKNRLRCLEVLVGALGDWDRINLDQILLYGMSTTLLVFRFRSLEGLRLVIENSKRITDKFAGLTSERGRILYVHTTEVDQVKNMRNDIKRIADSRRLLIPHETEDILFEKASLPNILRVLERRSRRNSILHNDFNSQSRKNLQDMVRVLNREITKSKIHEQSVIFFQSILKLRSTFTKVLVLPAQGKHHNRIVVSKGDDLSPFASWNKYSVYIPFARYHDFRDVVNDTATNVKVRILLENVPTHLHEKKWFQCGWKTIEKLEKMVERGEVYLTTAFENVTTRTHKGERCVTEVEVTAYGGGKVEDFLHAELLCSTLAAFQKEFDKGIQVAMRASLRTIPALQILGTNKA